MMFLIVALLLNGASADVSSLGSLAQSVVKIRSLDPTSGITTAASGLAFRHGGKAYILSAEHAVLNQPLPDVPRIVTFRQKITFVPGNPEPPEGGYPAAKIFRWIRILEREPIEVINGEAWATYEAEELHPLVRLPYQYEVLFPSGKVHSAQYLVSDWGKGITLLQFKEPVNESLLEWAALKPRMQSIPSSSLEKVTLGGYPAGSRRLQINPGHSEPQPYEVPTLAEVDAMTAIGDSSAEFGMSGGAAWDSDGNYVGLVSHLTADAAPERKVLLIPGDLIRNWLTQYLETRNLNIQLYKDVDQASTQQWAAFYSRGISFSWSCVTAPCLMRIDFSQRVNPSVSHPDHWSTVIGKSLERLRWHDKPHPGEWDRYVSSVTINGFRPVIRGLHEIGRRHSLQKLKDPVEFFHLLRNRHLVPIVEFSWNMTNVLEDKLEATMKANDRAQHVIWSALDAIRDDRRGTRSQREARAQEILKVHPLLRALETIGSTLREVKPGHSRDPHYYSATLIPADFDLLFTDPDAITAWEAIDRILPGRRPEFERLIRDIRFKLADFVVDTSESYQR